MPLFVAIDAIGNLPIVLALSEDLTAKQRTRLVRVAMVTASGVGLAFLFIGKFVLGLLSISVGHFAMAGGLVLLALSLRDLVTGRMMETPSKEEMIAIVPIGTPLTVGPATLTTLLLLSDEYSLPIVLLSLSVNLLVAWVVFLQGNRVARFLGQGGLKAVSKVMSLFLAAIAVRMVFKGLSLIWPG